MGETRARLALLLTQGITGSDWEELEAMLRAGDVAPRSDADLPRLGDALGRRVGPVDWAEVDRQLRTMERVGAVLLCRGDDAYPAALAHTALPPPVLFVRGRVPAPGSPAVAMVGTRKPSAAGGAFTCRLARAISTLGVTIVSGLARGIDTAAHEGALAGEGGTIAVVGTGVDVVYPPENGALTERIASEGSIISEQLCGTRAFAHVFPRRNRIISAFSDAVVVVEGGAKSGALITARWALEQGREVGAVPGFPGGFHSAGPNRLLKEGAFVVEDAVDVIVNVPALARYVAAAAREQAAAVPPAGAGLGGDAARVYSLVAAGATADDVAAAAGIAVEQAQGVLAFLEIEGRIRRDDAGRYTHTAQDIARA